MPAPRRCRPGDDERDPARDLLTESHAGRAGAGATIADVAAARGTFGPLIDRRHFLALAEGLRGGRLCAPAPPSRLGSGRRARGPLRRRRRAVRQPIWFDALHRLRAIVRASPDHLATLAATAVASGDPEAMVASVRDHIAVLGGSSAGAVHTDRCPVGRARGRWHPAAAPFASSPMYWW